MAQRIDRAALQEQFVREHSESGITAQAWCEQQGLNYQSARRYIKLRTAQSELRSAQKNAQKSAQLSGRKVRNSSQSAQSEMRSSNNNAQSEQRAQPKDSGGERGRERSSTSTQTSADSGQNSNTNGRDNKGRFTEGNYGNPSPVAKWKLGDRPALAHGGYAQFLDVPELFDQAEELRLRDELIFTRARVISVTKTLKALQQDLATATEMADRIALYDKLLKAEQALDRNIQRIESIERTLSAMRIDEVTGPKIEADTKRIQAATRKLTAEADLLEKDGGADTTPVAEMTAELQELGTGGLMS